MSYISVHLLEHYAVSTEVVSTISLSVDKCGEVFVNNVTVFKSGH